MTFSTRRDDNFSPAIFGVSSLDGKTPTAIKVNPVTGAMLIDSASLYAGLDSRYLQISNNLSEVTPATARTNLGLGTIATQAANNVNITGGTITGLSSPLPIASGGTNNASAYTAGSVIFSDGSKLTQDNSNLFWDNTNKRLGIGTNNPSQPLTLSATASSGLGTGIDETIVNTASSGNNNITGAFIRANFNGSYDQTSAAGEQAGIVTYAANISSHLLYTAKAHLAWTENTSTGAIHNAYGITTYIHTGGTGVITNAYGLRTTAWADQANITTYHGVHIEDGTSFGAQIGTQVGVYVSDQTGGTTNYAIYTGLGKVYHFDKLQTDNRFLLGADLSLIPIAGNQSVLSCWWGLQLVGNRQNDVDYTPSSVGNRDDASVIIPNQQAGKVGLLVYGASAQSGNLQEWRANGGVAPLSAVNSNGQIVMATSAGAPAGTPANGTMVYDTTNNKLWVYNGAWKGVVLA